MDFRQADAVNSAIRALALRHRGRALELLAPLKLHPGQEFVLMELAERGPRIQAQLATAINCEPPSVTLMVRKLEAAGHVRRRPSEKDGRAMIVELTDSGRRLSEQVRGLWVTLAEETVADLAPTGEIATLLRGLGGNLSRRKAAAAGKSG